MLRGREGLRNRQGFEREGLTDALLGDVDSQQEPPRQETHGESSASPPAPQETAEEQASFLLECLQSLKNGCGKLLESLKHVLDALLCRSAPAPKISIIQEERLQEIQGRIDTKFDSDNPEHQRALLALWRITFPSIPEPSASNWKSPVWKDMGWQGEDPATDFRGAGFLSLENLLWLAQQKPTLYRKLLHKEEGSRSEWEYPFAVSGLNLTFMLEDVLDLRHSSGVPHSKPGRGFLELLSLHNDAFEEVYAVSFALLDRTWLEARASYMDFPHIMASVKTRLSCALSLRPRDISELCTLLEMAWPS